MNNNNTIPSLPPQPLDPSEPEIPGDSNKMIIWFVIGLVGVILAVGGIFIFLSKQQPALKTQTSVSRTPLPTPKANLDLDLNSINVNNGIDSDFTSVDQDLKLL